MLAPWKESYDKPRQHIKKQRHYFANKCPYNCSYIFPVVMYGCESWTIKKAECQRIDAFELWCWRRLLQVPCIARKSNQSILKEINPEYSLERLMLRLQYFGHLMWTANSLDKDLDAGKSWGHKQKRMTEDEMVGWHHRLEGRVWASSGRWWKTGEPGVLQSMVSKELDSTKQLNNNNDIKSKYQTSLWNTI